MKNYLCKVLGPIDSLLSMIPEWVVNLAMRLVIFKVFWFSVQTKITGLTIGGQHFAFWNVTDSTFLLFDFEYGIPLIPSELAAYLGTFGEFFLALMILFGFMTRFAALGLMVMTMTIQFFVYPDAWWSVHVYWALILLYLMRNGGGLLSVDRLLLKR
ncbi:putative integral membrane protein [gamma proteobacterium IMCC1989]|nr:putative integral membrane protein [gamma proteobacterium IMCC1989]